MGHPSDIAIVGGGIIGLSVALELRERGLAVALLTRDVPGEAAQRAGVATPGAAGMLAIQDPRHPAALHPLMDLSRELYPAFLARIRELTGITIVHETNQRLDLLHGTQHTTPEPTVDNRALWDALFHACKTAGVAIFQGEMTGLDEEAAGVTVRYGAEELPALRWVNCAGAWAAALPGSGLPKIAITPRKGQMVRLRNTSREREVIYTPQLYVCARRNGSLLAGATVEDVGFDLNVEPQTVDYYRREAAALLPELNGAEVLEAWVGLRPGTPDNLPLIGQVSRLGWVAAGHFRDGILLAPGTARVLARMLSGETPDVDVAAFSPQRFTAGSDNRFSAAL